MITPSYLYWITRADHIRSALEGLLFFTTLLFGFAIIGYIGHILSKDEGGLSPALGGKLRRLCCISGTALALSVVARVFVPTTAEFAAISVIPAICNSNQAETVKQDFAEVYRLAVDYTKETLKKGMKK